MSDPVVSLHGGAVPQAARPNQGAIEVLEQALDMARSGEVQGVALAMLHADLLASHAHGGFTVGYAILGAATAMRDTLAEMTRECK